MPARVRAQISCEQTQSCDGNGEMNASSAFERQQRKFERKKKEKKKKARKMVRNKKIKFTSAESGYGWRFFL